MRERPKNLRAIPAVEKVLQAIGQTGLPRPVVVAVVRRELAALRAGGEVPAPDSVVANIRVTLDALSQSRLQPLINGTGVMIHTNLGRAPLGPAVVDTLSAMAANYNNLEYDLRAGERGGRAGYLEHNLALLCEAQAATVVNNCAAALVLILRHFTAGARKQVIISRGELVQIGGGFRIPEILESSGAVLREIGATNKTALADYSKAIGRESAMILKVHRSNFFMGGFVESPTTEELAALARRAHSLCRGPGQRGGGADGTPGGRGPRAHPGGSAAARRGPGLLQRRQTLRRTASRVDRGPVQARGRPQARAVFPRAAL